MRSTVRDLEAFDALLNTRGDYLSLRYLGDPFYCSARKMQTVYTQVVSGSDSLSILLFIDEYPNCDTFSIVNEFAVPVLIISDLFDRNLN